LNETPILNLLRDQSGNGDSFRTLTIVDVFSRAATRSMLPPSGKKWTKL